MSTVEVPKYIVKSIDDPGRYPAVLVADEKHGTRYLKAGTKEEFLASAVKLFTDRFDGGYWYYKPEKPSHLKTPAMTLEAAKALPDGEIKKMALSEHASLKRAQAEYAQELEDWKVIEAAAESKNGYLAWQVLYQRRDYEYEKVDLVKLE